MRTQIENYSSLSWAESATNYPAGTDDWSATPIKVEPVADYFTPADEAPAAHVNFELNAFGASVKVLDKFTAAIEPSVWKPAADLVAVAEALAVLSFPSGIVAGAEYDTLLKRWVVCIDPRDTVNDIVLIASVDGGNTWELSDTIAGTGSVGQFTSAGKPLCIDDRGAIVVWTNVGRAWIKEFGGAFTSFDAPSTPGGTALSGHVWIEFARDAAIDKAYFVIFAKNHESTGPDVYSRHAVQLKWTGATWAYTDATASLTAISDEAEWCGAKIATTDSVTDSDPTLFFFPRGASGSQAKFFGWDSGGVSALTTVPTWAASSGAKTVYPHSACYVVSTLFTGIAVLGISKTSGHVMQIFLSSDRGATWTQAIGTEPVSPAVTDKVFTEIAACGPCLVAVCGSDVDADATLRTPRDLFFTSPRVGTSAVSSFQTWSRRAGGKLLEAGDGGSAYRSMALRSNANGQMVAYAPTGVRAQFSEVVTVDVDATTYGTL